jgi:hypothetical protein
VRAKAEPRASDVPLHCKVCKQPLAATDGEHVLKYFLVKRPKPRQHQARPRDDQPRSASMPSPQSPASSIISGCAKPCTVIAALAGKSFPSSSVRKLSHARGVPRIDEEHCHRHSVFPGSYRGQFVRKRERGDRSKTSSKFPVLGIDDRSVRAFAVKPAPSARRHAALGLTARRGRANPATVPVMHSLRCSGNQDYTAVGQRPTGRVLVFSD